jgi:hypothetical protein
LKHSCAQDDNKIFNGEGRFQIRSTKLEIRKNANVPNPKDFSWFGSFEPLDFGFFNSSDLFGSGLTGLENNEKKFSLG